MAFRVSRGVDFIENELWGDEAGTYPGVSTLWFQEIFVEYVNSLGADLDDWGLLGKSSRRLGSGVGDMMEGQADRFPSLCPAL